MRKRKERTILKRYRLAMLSFLMLMLVLGTFATFIGVQAPPPEGSVALIPAEATLVKGSETSVFPLWPQIDLEVRVAGVTDIVGIWFSLEWNASNFVFDQILMGTKDPTDFIYEAGKPAGQYAGPDVTSVNASAVHEFYYTQMAGSYGYAPKSWTVANPGLVTKLRFNYTGPSPTMGYPIDTSINITDKGLDELMRTGWAKWITGTTLNEMDFSPMLPFHLHYEVALEYVHLESEEDTSASTNLGNITFDDVTYSLPDDVSKAAGTYSAEYFADAGYLFDRWETTGLVSVSDANANPTTVTVSGDGTLKAVYKAVTYTVHLESDEDTGTSTNLGTITFDDVTYSLPDDVSKMAGTYQAQYNPASGYVFYHWETTGMVSVTDANANPVTATVSDDGTLKAMYKAVTYTVHLESEEDTGVSANLGTINFDGVSYTLPQDVSKAAGTYQAQYFADAGYVFDHWETTGLVSVTNTNANPTTVTVSGNGTLKAIYREVTVTYTVHLESEVDIGTSTNLGNITFDDVTYSLPEDVSKMAGTYQAQYFAYYQYTFYYWETTGMVSVTDANANPTTVTVSGDGTLKAIYASHHFDHLHDDYAPMVIPVNDKNLTIVPVITCTVFVDGVWSPFYHPCKLAQTTLTDDDWSDGDANYTYVFEDWIDYDWNDIVVVVYAVTDDVITIEIRLADREAAWKNPFGVLITLVGMDVQVYWNSTDYPEEHMVRVNSSETEDIELFDESKLGDNASITIIPIIPPTYTLTITSTSGGTTDPVPGSYSYDEGTVVSVTAIPDSGYIFDHWELDEVNVGSANPIDVTMDANHTLHAVFTEITYTLIIITTTGGTTSPSPGIHVYPYGTNVEVTAIPYTDYQFDHWELNDVNKGSVNPIYVLMDEDYVLRAVFRKTKPVGGRAMPIDKPHLLVPKIGLTPRIGLASVFLASMAVTVILIRRKKRH